MESKPKTKSRAQKPKKRRRRIGDTASWLLRLTVINRTMGSMVFAAVDYPVRVDRKIHEGRRRVHVWPVGLSSTAPPLLSARA